MDSRDPSDGFTPPLHLQRDKSHLNTRLSSSVGSEISRNGSFYLCLFICPFQPLPSPWPSSLHLTFSPHASSPRLSPQRDLPTPYPSPPPLTPLSNVTFCYRLPPPLACPPQMTSQSLIVYYYYRVTSLAPLTFTRLGSHYFACSGKRDVRKISIVATSWMHRLPPLPLCKKKKK